MGSAPRSRGPRRTRLKPPEPTASVRRCLTATPLAGTCVSQRSRRQPKPGASPDWVNQTIRKLAYVCKFQFALCKFHSYIFITRSRSTRTVPQLNFWQRGGRVSFW